MKRSWVTGAAVAVVLLGVVALAVVRGRPQPGEPDPPVSAEPLPSTAAEDSVLPPSLRASLEQGGPVDAILTVPDLLHDRETEHQIRLDDGVGIVFRSPIARLSDVQGRRLRKSLVRVRKPLIPPDCVFLPDVVYRFGAHGDSLRVIVCHGCGEIMVRAREGQWISTLEAERDTLLTLTAELFPGDARIADIRSGKIRM